MSIEILPRVSVPESRKKLSSVLLVQSAASEVCPGSSFLTTDLDFTGQSPERVPDLLRQMEGCIRETGPQSLRGGEILWERTADPRLDGIQVCQDEKCICIKDGHSGCIIFEEARRGGFR